MRSGVGGETLQVGSELFGKEDENKAGDVLSRQEG